MRSNHPPNRPQAPGNRKREMSIYISILRGINVGGRNKSRMAALKALYEALGMKDVQTYIQSGNIVFAGPGPGADEKALAPAIRETIEKEFGCRVAVLVRPAGDWRSVAADNPFHANPGIDPGKLLELAQGTAQ